MTTCDYNGCTEEATHNVADARGEAVGCYKVCLAHARGIVASKSFGAIWARGVASLDQRPAVVA